MLNEYNEQTKGVIHLAVTTLCNRNCYRCCNDSYSWDEVPHATDEELRNCHTILLTGGEPFEFSNPCAIAQKLRRKYPNIQHVYAYGNAFSIWTYLQSFNQFHSIDGITISVKNGLDEYVLEKVLTHPSIAALSSNRLYNIQPSTFATNFTALSQKYNIQVLNREWQTEDFQPDPNSVFRRI